MKHRFLTVALALLGALAPIASGTVTHAQPHAPVAQLAGAPLRGELAQGDDRLPSGEYVDRHVVTIPVGRPARIEARSSAFDTYLIVRPPQGQEIQNDDQAPGNLDAAVDLASPVAGSYEVLVTSYEPGETGAYELFVSGAQVGGIGPSPSPFPAPPAPAGGAQLLQGALEASDPRHDGERFIDWHEIDVPTAGPLSIHVRGAFDTYLFVQGPDGQSHENDDIQGSLQSGLDLPFAPAGRYRVGVSSYEPATTGAYTVHVGAPHQMPPVDGATAPVRPAPGPVVRPQPGAQRLSGRLEANDATRDGGAFIDWHQVTLPAGGPLSIHLRSADMDTYLVVQTPDGQTHENDDLDGSLQSGVDLPSAMAGTYRIGASSYEAAATGAYSIHIGSPSQMPSVSAAAEAPGRVFGMFVGVADYPDGGDLPRTDEDAINLARGLSSRGLMNEQDGILLTDAQATRQNVRAGLAQLAQRVGPEDTFIFFFSGHGNQEGPGATNELDGRDESIALYDGIMLDDELVGLLGGISARVSILSLDSCRAGGFARDFIDRPGRIGLFSSEEDVNSGVPNEAGGYLAMYLHEAVQGRADADHDATVTAEELTHYLHRRYGEDPAVRTDNGWQHLVADRGAVSPRTPLWTYPAAS